MPDRDDKISAEIGAALAEDRRRERHERDEATARHAALDDAVGDALAKGKAQPED